MRPLPLFAVFIILACSCRESKQKQYSSRDSVIADQAFVPALQLPDYNYNALQGTYSGDFGGSNILITISHLSGRHAEGYSVHLGLKRNFNGDMQPGGKGFMMKLKEPGDNKYDGVFDCVIDTATHILSGSWKPNNASAASAKQFQLKPYNGVLDTSAEAQRLFTDNNGGNYDFDPNGTIVYQYYEKGHDRKTGDDEEEGQRKAIRGNWIIEGDKITVDWEPNNKFTRSGMIFRRKIEDYTLTLTDEKGNAMYPAGLP